MSGSTKGNPAERQLLDDRLDAIRIEVMNSLPVTINRLGGDPERVFAAVECDLPNSPQTEMVSYRMFVKLLEAAVAETGCSHIGLELGSRQEGLGVCGPLKLAMRNSPSIADAFRFCADNIELFSPGVFVDVERHTESNADLIVFDTLLNDVPFRRQTVEHACLLIQDVIVSLAGGQGSAREIWFQHQPLSPARVYTAFFGVPVYFGKPCNGVLIDSALSRKIITDRSEQIYLEAKAVVEGRSCKIDKLLSRAVIAKVRELISDSRCSFEYIAKSFDMHPRAFQRQLSQEAVNFEDIKDAVRRETTLRLLCESDLPLLDVTASVGYSESSVLSRSCARWFASSPRMIRANRSHFANRVSSDPFGLRNADRQARYASH